MRGYAALAVCFYHLVVLSNITESTLLLSIFDFGKKGVQVFFILSGVVIPLSMIKSGYQLKQLPRFLFKRIIRIEPPYLVALLLGFAFLHFKQLDYFSFAETQTPTGYDLMLHLGYLVPFFPNGRWINPVFWTLAIEFQFYIYTALTLPLALSKSNSLKFCFVALLSVSSYFSTYDVFFFAWANYFGLGIVYALHRSKVWGTTDTILAMILLGSGVLYYQGLTDLLIAVFVIGAVHLWPFLQNEVGQFFGKISYSLYLIHSIVGVGLLQFTAEHVSSPSGKFFLIIAAFALSIVAAYGLWKWVENPSKIAASKIKL